jgi:hypothetical protein
MWAVRMEGMYRIMGIMAYWIGIPAMGLGVLLRIRSVPITSSTILPTLINRTSKMQFT